jgi:F-type H+-transporting ATPase subunit b
MQTPMFFYAVAFFLFLALVFLFGRKPALQWIDGEIAKISAELTAAAQLRAEAEAALADCKAKQARAETEAKMIVEMAKKEVEAMRKQADTDMANTLAHQQQLATERIHMAQAEAIAGVRAAAISMGMELARKTLIENLSEAEATKLVEQAIADIPALNKAKA